MSMQPRGINGAYQSPMFWGQVSPGATINTTYVNSSATASGGAASATAAASTSASAIEARAAAAAAIALAQAELRKQAILANADEQQKAALDRANAVLESLGLSPLYESNSTATASATVGSAGLPPGGPAIPAQGAP